MSDADKKKQLPNSMPKNILTDLAAEFLYSAEVNSKDAYGGLSESLRDYQEDWLKWAKCESP